jgi:hypothetical protein
MHLRPLREFIAGMMQGTPPRPMTAFEEVAL